MPDRICSIDDCDRPVLARGWCSLHYNRWHTENGPLRLPLVERFMTMIDQRPDGCWCWTGFIGANGYSRFRAGERGTVGAHRWSYEYFVGPIPDGFQIDHLCRVRHCVNPAHLEPVTPRENTLRGEGVAAKNARRAHCIHGHPFSGTNLYLNAGRRRCRICRQEREQERQARRRKAQHATGDFV